MSLSKFSPFARPETAVVAVLATALGAGVAVRRRVRSLFFHPAGGNAGLSGPWVPVAPPSVLDLLADGAARADVDTVVDAVVTEMMVAELAADVDAGLLHDPVPDELPGGVPGDGVGGGVDGAVAGGRFCAPAPSRPPVLEVSLGRAARAAVARAAAPAAAPGVVGPWESRVRTDGRPVGRRPKAPLPSAAELLEAVRDGQCTTREIGDRFGLDTNQRLRLPRAMAFLVDEGLLVEVGYNRVFRWAAADAA